MIEKCPKCAQAGVDKNGEPLFVCRECLQKTLDSFLGRVSMEWQDDIKKAVDKLEERIDEVSRGSSAGQPY